MSLKLLGLMRRANALSIGQDNAIPAVKNGKAKLLLLSSDASERNIRNAENAVKGKKTELIYLPYTNEEMAGAIGVDSCTMLAVTDKGFAEAFKKSLNNQT